MFPMGKMMNKSIKIGVIGAGSWGTALAILLAKKGYLVNLWGHNDSHVSRLSKDRENRKYLPGIIFPQSLHPESELDPCIDGADTVVMVVPSHSYRTVFQKIIPLLSDNQRIVTAVKGIENDTLMTMTQVMEQELACFSGVQNIGLGVLSGPSFAEEVAREIPTAVTLGFKDIEMAKEVQKIFGTEYFRVYASSDMVGLEISAALKNIIAIATGVCDGLGYGLNTRAALITRGLAEITRLGTALKADVATFSGLSGMGDLILTCTGNLSRNRNVGLKLGSGKSIEQVKSEMNMVAEGIKTTKSVYDLAAKMGIEMPILEQVYNIIYRNKNCSEAVKDLLNRELKVE
ncbi:glycerol 3-phosphate dehydrogenase (NAD(P)+) [Desulforhopalus singaporensis]|uniref:Glycerol-3-phosphate dehydrogenase [NAD(P)+] n=2 Tax=Desulforhopalus singaporensis TaxID=91360 RepID=A0A1H0VBG9_9BACT|nr:glycerol 3-phosphate dehydrogenase (NAD(P)+) [Desulforhopalus singaporensis]